MAKNKFLNQRKRGIIKKILPKKIVEHIRYKNVAKRLNTVKKSQDFLKLHEEVKQIKKYLQNPKHLIDIGANCGEISFYLSKEYPNAKIYAFEPGTRAFNVLRKIKKKFHLNNLLIYKMALGDKKEIVGMEFPDSNDTLAFITKRKNSKNKVRIEKLDDFIAKKKITQIDFIKIDVEGFEMKILNGGANSIKKSKPLMLVEVDEGNQKRFNHSSKDILDFMKKMKYEKIQHDNNYLFIPKRK
ncbi:FkbM family methyltransferase [Candidatus Pacearchaeota archaeon]|nr:FkbM family methyltransferase [Candidatus Pacearchaeota archaeon]